jgi:hypothetical protein
MPAFWKSFATASSIWVVALTPNSSIETSCRASAAWIAFSTGASSAFAASSSVVRSSTERSAECRSFEICPALPSSKGGRA